MKRLKLVALPLAGLCGLFCLAVAGCGGRAGSKAEVSGKVTFQKAPVRAGSISFHGENNLVGRAQIGADGSYSMPDAPVGKVKVTISTPPPTKGGMKAPAGVPMPKGMGPMKAPDGSKGGDSMDPKDMMGGGPPLPEKYSDPDKSGLEYTVERGKQTKDFDLTP